jgi:hypothetical protein
MTKYQPRWVAFCRVHRIPEDVHDNPPKENINHTMVNIMFTQWIDTMIHQLFPVKEWGDHCSDKQLKDMDKYINSMPANTTPSELPMYSEQKH